MDKIFTSLKFMRLIFLVMALCAINLSVRGQVFTYTDAALTVEITAYNPCGSPTPDNGFIDIKIVAASGGIGTLIFLDGPGPLFASNVPINVGSTYRFNAPSNSLPDGIYNYIIRDEAGSIINSFSDPIPYPAIVLRDLTPTTLTEDIRIDNTVCTNPTTGQVQASIVGGSQALPGGGSYSYEWDSPNGLAGLPLTGTTDGTTPLNLAALLGVPGIPGGTYTLTVVDLYSACSQTQRSITITDPSPVIQTVTTPTPYNVCAGDNLTITMSGSESGVSYTIMRNGIATANTFLGTGSGPFVMTFPPAGFSNADVIRVRATNGFCSPTMMLNAVVLRINPIPTVSTPALADVCQGLTQTTFTYGSTTGSPSQFSIDFDLTAQGQGFVDIVNATLTASPIAITIPPAATPGTYNGLLSVRNTTTGCPSTPIPITVTIVANPAITLAANPAVCLGATTAGLAYTATVGSPNQYSINFDLLAEAQGFADVPNTSLPASPISFNVPVGAVPGTYNATITVGNTTTGCSSSTQPFTITINPTPGVTLTPIPAICQGTTAAILAYSTIVGGADRYIIDFNAAANTAGLLDVPLTTLPASPINITVPAAIAAATYSGTVTIRNSVTGCTSALLPISITVNPSPTITVTNLNPAVCLGATSTTLAYTATTGSPTQYSLDFNLAAEAQGFADIVTVGLPASPITVAIPPAAIPGTYTATLSVRNGTTTCVGAGQTVTITINPAATITLTNPNPQICRGALVVPMPYTGLAGGANQYSIDFNAAANTAGFIDVVNTNIPASPINITVSAATVAGTYNATLTVRNSTTGCVSSTQPITITINPTPTITLSAIPAICQGVTSVNLGYTATTGSPSQYTIDFSAAANTAGFTDVTATALPATPIVIAVPAGAAPGSYTATVVVTNLTTTCPSAPQTITIVINGNPTIALTNANPQVCIGATTAPLAYSATTGSPNQYSLDFDLTAQGQGFLDVTNQLLPASPIPVSIPGGAIAGTYNATLTIRNSITNCGSTSLPVTVTINPTPGATLTPIAAICQGTTSVPLAYSAVVGGADRYSIDFNAAANTAGFLDVAATALPASPIGIPVPGAVAAGTYNATVTISNSVTGCTSAALPISITVNPSPTITVTNLNPAVCLGATSTTLAYTATTGSPTQYSLDFNLAAEAQGFADIVTVGLPASPITVAIPPAAVPGTYTATLTVRNGTTTCVGAGQTVTITINPAATITLTNPNPQICLGTLVVPMPYTGLAGGANQYSIDFNAAANTAGFIDVVNTNIPASPINITVSAATVAGTYNATFTVRNNTTGCVSSTQPITITINPTPTITLSAIPAICQGTTSVNLGYTATSGGPTQYTIDFSAAANTAGFTDVTATALPATPIVIAVPGGAAPGSYTATVVVTNLTTTCPSAPQTITIVINGNPTIALTNANPQVCIGATTAPLAYSATTGSPDQYSLDFDLTAQGQGFLDVTNQLLPASPIPVSIPGGAIAGTYNATLTIRNSITNCGSTSLPVTITINPTPAVTWIPVPDVCAGATTATLAYGAPVGGPNQYVIDFDAIAQTAGFVDVPATTLPAGSITLVVPVAAAPATYNATVQVINSVTGCVSTLSPITILINPTPGITITDLTPSACLGTATIPLAYTATTGSPTVYSIDFNAAAQLQGFVDVVGAPLAASPITINIPPAAIAGTYTAIITVSNGTTTCTDAGQTLTITLDPAPSITLNNVDPEVCLGATTVTFPYSAVGGGADQFALDFDVAAQAQGFTDIALGALTASPISVNIPGGAVAGTYNAILTVASATSGCSSAAIPVTVNINALPTVTVTPIAAVCVGTGSVNLTYTVTGTPNQINIDFDVAAQAQGFTDLAGVPLTASPFAITIPPGAVAGTYNATVSVINSTTTCVSATQNISITLNPSPTATITGPASVCAGTATQLTVTFTGTAPWSFTYSDGMGNTSPIISTPFNTFSIPIANPTTTTTYEIESLTDGTVCGGITGSTHLLTINQPPLTNLPVSAVLDPLCVGGITDIQIDNTQAGVDYLLRNDADNSSIGTAVTSTGGTIFISTGVLTVNTTFNVLASVTGCTPVELANTVTVTVSGSINAGISVTAAASPICAGTGTSIIISPSENGVLYQLHNDTDNVDVGAQMPGTGGPISISTNNLASTKTFSVIADNGTCSIQLTNTATVTVGTPPDATLVVDVVFDPLCTGGNTDIIVRNTQTGITYQLRDNSDDSNVGAAIVSTGGDLTFNSGTLTTNTTFNVLATAAGCGSVELNSLAVVNVSGTIDATLAVAPVDASICQGTATFIEITNSEAGVTYDVINETSGASVGTAVGTGANIQIGTLALTATTTFHVVASNAACTIQLNNTATVNVDINPNTALVIVAAPNPLCTGGTSTITLRASQLGVRYQLRDDSDDSNIGGEITGTGGDITFTTPALSTNTSFNILARSGVCADVEMGTVVAITVSGTVNAGLTVSTSAASICSGSGTFIQIQASEAGISYQVVILPGLTPVGTVTGNGGTVSVPTGNLTATTDYGVIASNGTCSIQLTDTETITVNPSPILTLSVTALPNLICANSSSTISIANSQNGISYQLRNNGVDFGTAVAGNGSTITISTGPLSANATFTVFAIAGTCSALLNNAATVTIRPVGDPACGAGPGDCTNFSVIQPSIVAQPSCNDRDAGEVSFNISRADGTPTTFRILWTINGNTQTKFTSSTASFDDLSSGLYQYTVIDEGNGKVCGPVDFFLDLKTQVEILAKQVSANVTCFGGTDGNAILTVDGTTTGEYWYRYVVGGVESTAQTFTPGAPLPGGLPADDNNFIIIKVDDNFNFTCPDTVMVRVKHTYAKIDFAVAATDVTTCNGTDGTINVSGIAGGDSGTTPLQVRLKKAVPFSTDPSGYIVVSDFADVAGGVKAYTALSQGNYIVDVRDHLDCIQSKPIAVQAPGQVPLSAVGITAIDATCDNSGESGAIRVTISEAGIYKVAISRDQLNVPADADFIDYQSPSLPNVTFADLSAGAYYLYIKSSTTTCPTRTDAIMINGVKALTDFEVLSNCGNVNLTINNITGQQDRPFVIRVFSNDDKFFKIDSLAASTIPLSNSVTFTYAPPQHTFLNTPGTYRFVMVQTQTTGAGSCTLRSDTVVYTVRELLGIALGTVKPSFPQPKHTGSIEIANVTGGTRFVGANNELYYEISLTTADDDIVVKDWEKLTLDPQNKFVHLYDYLPPGVYRVKVRDAAGCIKTLDVEIPLETGIFVPNIFTPNNDGINDEFEVLNLPISGTHQVIITNRWGNEVFKSGDYREGNFWNADNVADGIYYYRLKVDGGDTLNGWVEIVRGSKP